MVWANCGKQNSRLVTFLPGSRLPFAVVSYIYRKMGRERLKLLSKMASKKWNTNFRLGHYDRENGFFFFRLPLVAQIFHRNDPTETTHLLSNLIFRKLLVNGIQIHTSMIMFSYISVLLTQPYE